MDRYKCIVCGFSAHYRYKLKIHESGPRHKLKCKYKNEMENNNIKWSYDNYVKYKNNKMNKLFKQKTKNSKKYYCSNCDISFDSPYKLRKHNNYNHKSDENLTHVVNDKLTVEFD